MTSFRIANYDASNQQIDNPNSPSTDQQMAATLGWTNIGPSSSENLICLGDSLTGLNYYNDATNTFWQDRGMVVWGNAIAGAPFNILSATGLSGKPAATIYNLLPGILALLPDANTYVVLAGTNDLINGYAAKDIIVSLANIYRLLRVSGKAIIACTIPPSSSYTTAAQQKALDTVNRWIRDTAMRTSGFKLADLYTALADSTSSSMAPIASYFTDGIHLSSIGAQTAGLYALAPVLAAAGKKRALVTSFGPQASASNAYGNAIINPTYVGAGGNNQNFSGATASGPVPDNWNVLASGAGTNPVSSKVARTDWPQKNWFKFTGTILNTTGYVILYSVAQDVSTYWVPGNYADGFLELVCTTLTNVQSISVSIVVQNAGGTTIYTSTCLSSSGTVALNAFGTLTTPAILQLPKFIIPVGTKTVSLQLTIAPTTSNATIDIRLGDPEIRQIDPAQLNYL